MGVDVARGQRGERGGFRTRNPTSAGRDRGTDREREERPGTRTCGAGWRGDRQRRLDAALPRDGHRNRQDTSHPAPRPHPPPARCARGHPRGVRRPLSRGCPAHRRRDPRPRPPPGSGRRQRPVCAGHAGRLRVPRDRSAGAGTVGRARGAGGSRNTPPGTGAARPAGGRAHRAPQHQAPGPRTRGDRDHRSALLGEPAGAPLRHPGDSDRPGRAARGIGTAHRDPSRGDGADRADRGDRGAARGRTGARRDRLPRRRVRAGVGRSRLPDDPGRGRRVDHDRHPATRSAPAQLVRSNPRITWIDGEAPLDEQVAQAQAALAGSLHA